MVLSWNSVYMSKEFQNTDKLMDKSLSIIRKNIDNGNVKTEVFSIKTGTKGKRSNLANHLKVNIHRKEYEYVLDKIMEYFIENEWYEDCVVIKEYKEKLKKLQDERPARTNPKSVKN